MRIFVDIEDGMDVGVADAVVVVVIIVAGPRIKCCPSKSKEFKYSLSLEMRKTC